MAQASVDRRAWRAYHFSLGNSADGPVGYCARVLARSKADAVEILKGMLEDCGAVDGVMLDGSSPWDVSQEYMQAYFNTDAITVKDIDEWEYERPDVGDD